MEYVDLSQLASTALGQQDRTHKMDYGRIPIRHIEGFWRGINIYRKLRVFCFFKINMTGLTFNLSAQQPLQSQNKYVQDIVFELSSKIDRHISHALSSNKLKLLT